MNSGGIDAFVSVSEDESFSTETTHTSIGDVAINVTSSVHLLASMVPHATNELPNSGVLRQWPDWSTARAELKWTWMVHTYGFACVFFMLAFYAFFSVLNLRAQLSTRPYMSSINVFLCVLGASRTICFLVDPYQSKRIMPQTFGSILWELAFPSLISGFALIQLAFLQLTRLRLGPAKLRSKTCMSLAITSHFIATIAINIVFTYRNDLKVLRIACQTAFLVWGGFLCLSFLHGGVHTMRLLKDAPSSMFLPSDASGFENKVVALGMLANCHNMAVMTATAAAVPSFLAAPKIRITDENERTYSYISDSLIRTGDNNHRGTSKAKSNEHCLSLTGGKVESQNSVYTLAECSPPIMTPYDSEGPQIPKKNSIRQNGVPPSRKQNNRQAQCAVKSNDNPIVTNDTTKKARRSSPGILEKDVIVDGGGIHHSSNGILHSASRSIPETKDGLEMNTLPSRMSAQYDEFKQDVTLMSILNHIAYVNRAADDYSFDAHKLRPKSRKGQIEKVLHGTYASAVLGFLLCLLEAFRIYGPYGMLASTSTATAMTNTVTRPQPWPWFIFQTISRIIELTMGCIMANITKQPVNRHHYPYSYHMKHRGGGLYF